MTREATKEATTTDPNSVLEIESMELPVILNGKNLEISDSNTSDLDDELDTLIQSAQNQNEATTPPVTTPTTNKVFISPRVFSSSSIGFKVHPFQNFLHIQVQVFFLLLIHLIHPLHQEF